VDFYLSLSQSRYLQDHQKLALLSLKMDSSLVPLEAFFILMAFQAI
jgi:hypothetical protein